ERRLPLRRLRGAGWRPRDGAGCEHRGRDRVLRSDAWHRAEIRRQGRHQPELADPVRRDDAELPGLGRSGRADRTGAREDDQPKKGDLRPRAADDGRDRVEDVPVRGCDHREYVDIKDTKETKDTKEANTLASWGASICMNRKVTVVGGAGNVGATVARGVADKQL